MLFITALLNISHIILKADGMFKYDINPKQSVNGHEYDFLIIIITKFNAQLGCLRKELCTI